MTKEEREALKAERQRCNDQIDAAYWLFTRCARAKPPCLVVPEAYKRRAEIDALLSSRSNRPRQP